MKIPLILTAIIFLGLILLLPLKTSPHTDPSPSPSPSAKSEPFYDLTVPALRERHYQSALQNREEYQVNPEYTSYLTSYVSDGFKINGLLTIPNGEKPRDGWPAIVFVHGYIPPRDYQTTLKYGDYVDFLAQNGFVVFKVDLRGHGDSEGQPGGGYYGADYVADTLNARAALQSAGFVNKDKVGLWGHSMAGNIVMRSLAARPEIPVAVIWAGAGYSYIDLQKYSIKDASYDPRQADPLRVARGNEIRKLYGNPSDGNPFWKQVAPIYFLNDLKGAVQIHHSVDDATVNVGYSRDLVAELDKTKVPHEFYEYSNGGHNISGSSFVSAMQNTVDFYHKYLK